MVYFLSLLLTLVSAAIYQGYSLSRFWNLNGGQATLVAFVISAIVSYTLMKMLVSHRDEIGLDEQQIGRHYLASAIGSYHQESGTDVVLEYLGEFVEYISNRREISIPPKRQQQLQTYIRRLSEADDEKQVREMLDETFIENMEITITEIQDIESRELTIPNRDPDGEQLPTTADILIESVANFIEPEKLKYLYGFAILGLAAIGYTVVGQGLAIVILGTHPILYPLISDVGDSPQER